MLAQKSSGFSSRSSMSLLILSTSARQRRSRYRQLTRLLGSCGIWYPSSEVSAVVELSFSSPCMNHHRASETKSRRDMQGPSVGPVGGQQIRSLSCV